MKTGSVKTLAHHNDYSPIPINNREPNINTLLERLTYGVPTTRRMITPGVLNKKHHLIVGYLGEIGLTAAERQVTLELLRLFAYYGKVYPKANAFEELRGCSRRSFWRAIAKLEEVGFVDRINRYLNHRQISNAYRLDKLVLCIIRYLTEHGLPFLDQFTRDILRDTAAGFWNIIKKLRVRLRDPIPITATA